MLNQFITNAASELQLQGYLVEAQPQILGVQALLYARSPKDIRMALARVQEHFLFVDWENALFGRLEELKEQYRRFQQYANQGFKTPHGLRIRLPSLAFVAVSETGFPEDALYLARNMDMSPWYGGEVGQVVLVDLASQQIICLESLNWGSRPRPGAVVLEHAAGILYQACEGAFARG